MYTKYNIYYGTFDSDTPRKFKDKPWVDVVSCDPGVVNFSTRVERRYPNGIIEVLLAENINITDTRTKTRYEQLHDLMDSHRDIFVAADLFIVERQLPKNFVATAISNHALSYFMSLRKHFSGKEVIIMDITAKNKGLQLSVPKKCQGYWLKRWSVLRAYELFKCRNDTAGVLMLDSADKRDDLADTAIQIEAVFRILGLGLTPNFDHDAGPKTTEEVKTEWKKYLLDRKKKGTQKENGTKRPPRKRAKKPPAKTAKKPRAPRKPKEPKMPKEPRTREPRKKKELPV